MPRLKPEPLPLKLEQRTVETIQKLRHGFPLWARICYYIRTKRKTIEPLRLNHPQRQTWLAERQMLERYGRARIIVLKARQGGVTTGQQAANLHAVWAQKHVDAMTLAHTAPDTGRIFVITNRAVQYFPPEMLPAMGPKATAEVSFPGLDTHFWTGSAGASRTGRGLTLKRVHGSEFAFWDDPGDILSAIAPALVPNRSVIVLETTADEMGSAAHEFWLAAMRGENGYLPLFFPWWECDREHYRMPLLAPDELGELTDEEAALMAGGLNLEQIKWRRATMREFGRRKFFREYAEDPDSCWAAVGEMFFDEAQLRVLKARAPQPIGRLEQGGLSDAWGSLVSRAAPQMTGTALGHRQSVGIYQEGLTFYGDPPVDGESVVIGVDTAEGSGLDSSAFVARALPDWRLLMTFNSSTITPGQLAALLADWGERLEPREGRAYLVIEKNAHGITVLRDLRDKYEYPSSDIYHRMPPDREKKTKRSERIGWHTSAETKPLMLDAARDLFSAAEDGYAGVPAAEVIGDAMGVQSKSGGVVELTGRDMLVAEMLCWLGRFRARRGISVS